MEETYREESVWGKECKTAVIDLQSPPMQDNIEKRAATVDLSEQNTIVESKMMNPLASLVRIKS